MEGDRQVGRDRPRRRRPDEHRRRGAGRVREARRKVRPALRREREVHVDRRRDVRLVLHLGVGERRAAVDAPVDRLLAPVDEVLLDEGAQGADDRRLVAVAHREVRPLPVAEDAEALEVLPHLPDAALREAAALPAHVGHAHPAPRAPAAAVHLQLDRQPVAVPPRHVGGVEAGHRARAHHEVLEDLVERRPEVNPAVGVGRSVVQDELRRAPPAPGGSRRRGHLPPSGRSPAARSPAGWPSCESRSGAD